MGVSKAVVSRVSKVCNDFQMNYLAEEWLLTFSIQFSHSVVSDSLRTWDSFPWTVAHQAPLSMGFSRQEYWSGLPFPSPGDSS